MTERISSIKDPRIVRARQLSSAAGRSTYHGCLLEGERAIRWALEAGSTPEYVLVHDRADPDPMVDELTRRDIQLYSVTDGIQKKVTGRRYVVPLVGVLELTEPKRGEFRGSLVVVLDDVRDQGNIGTIVRSARGFGVQDLMVTPMSADLWGRKTVEASRGKVFEVNFHRYPTVRTLVDALRAQDYQIVATSPHAPVLQSRVELDDRPAALVLGNEGEGVSDELLRTADQLIRIPLAGRVESLNVGVAAGISLYEIKTKLVIAMLVKSIRTTLGREVNVAGKLLQMGLDRALHKVSPLTGNQVIFLMVLKCDGRMMLEQVSRDTATFGVELEKLLRPLYDDELIVGDPVGEAVVLTGRGDQLLGDLWGVVEEAEEAALAGFSSAERVQFRTLLDRIQATVNRCWMRTIRCRKGIPAWD